MLPVLTYAYETGTVSKGMEKRTNAAEMWFVHRNHICCIYSLIKLLHLLYDFSILSLIFYVRRILRIGWKSRTTMKKF